MAQRREGSRPRDPRFLEGSRFVSWQLFRIAAGGSRELPSVCPAGRMRLAKPLIRKAALELPSSGAVLGSRLSTPKAFGGCQLTELPSYKAAPLQVLGGWYASSVCKPYRVHSSPNSPNCRKRARTDADSSVFARSKSGAI